MEIALKVLEQIECGKAIVLKSQHQVTKKVPIEQV